MISIKAKKALVLAGAFAVGQLQAAIIGTSLGTAAPPATLGGFSMTAFPQDNRTGSVTSVPSPLGGNVSFGTAVKVRQIGKGWATWSHNYQDSVYFNSSQSITLTLPPATGAFYLYAEPNPFEVHTIIATANDGTQVVQQVNGNHGASGYGFHTTGGSMIVSITVSSPTAELAVGEFGIANLVTIMPEPQTYAAFAGLGLLGFVGFRRLRRK